MSIYLDNAATTPLMPEAAQAMKRYYSADFYNPSALYSKSRHVRDKIEEARSVIAGLIGAEPEEISLHREALNPITGLLMRQCR